MNILEEKHFFLWYACSISLHKERITDMMINIYIEMDLKCYVWNISFESQESFIT